MVWVTPTPGEFNQLCLTVTKKWTPCQTFWAHRFKRMTNWWRLHVRKLFATHWWGLLWQPHPSRGVPLRHTLTNIIFRGTKYPMIGQATILFDELFPLPKWHHLIYIYLYVSHHSQVLYNRQLVNLHYGKTHDLLQVFQIDTTIMNTIWKRRGVSFLPLF